MKSRNLVPRHYEILAQLSVLPKKIVSLHESDTQHISEFVLHELCNTVCFNVEKAAYFVDNPDFDCLKGVAGFNQREHISSPELKNSRELSEHMRHCHFDKEVKKVSHGSCKKAEKKQLDITRDLAHALSISQPQCIIWDLKHDNHGILIYQVDDKLDDIEREYMLNGVHFLSFCPII